MSLLIISEKGFYSIISTPNVKVEYYMTQETGLILLIQIATPKRLSDQDKQKITLMHQFVSIFCNRKVEKLHGITAKLAVWSAERKVKWEWIGEWEESI